MANPFREAGKLAQNQWDWVFIGLGTLGGGAASVLMHGADLGQSVGAGAVAGVTLRQSIVASMRGHYLKKRAEALKKEISESINKAQEISHNQDSENLKKRKEILTNLDNDMRLWKIKGVSKRRFSEILSEYVEEYRKTY